MVPSQKFPKKTRPDGRIDVTGIRVGATVTWLEGFVLPLAADGTGRVVWAVVGNETVEGVMGAGVEAGTIVAQGSGF